MPNLRLDLVAQNDGGDSVRIGDLVIVYSTSIEEDTRPFGGGHLVTFQDIESATAVIDGQRVGLSLSTKAQTFIDTEIRAAEREAADEHISQEEV